jgi:PAS domain-containing protein
VDRRGKGSAGVKRQREQAEHPGELRRGRERRRALTLQKHLRAIGPRQAGPPARRAGDTLFRGLVEASPIPMLVITADAAGRMLLMNARFKQTFGYTEEDLPAPGGAAPPVTEDAGHRPAGGRHRP